MADETAPAPVMNDDQIAALFGAMPVVGGTLPASEPIGVPADYVATRSITADQSTGAVLSAAGLPVPADAQNGFAPRYYEGDDVEPASWSPDRRAELQRALVAARLIPRGTVYLNGIWDDVSRDAYRTLLAYANASGTDWRTAIDEYAAAVPTNFTPDPYMAPDNATLSQQIKELVRTKLGGREATAAELDTLVGYLRQQDRGQYDAQVAAQRQAVETGEAPTVVQDVDPVARFNEFFEQRYKPEMQRIDGVAAGQAMRQSLLGSVEQVDQMIEGAA